MCHERFWPRTHILSDRLDISRLIDECKSAKNATGFRFGLWEPEEGLLCKIIMDDTLDASVAHCLDEVWWRECNGVQHKQQQVKLSAV